MAETKLITVNQFASIINGIEYQKTYLFKIHLPLIQAPMMGIISPGEQFNLCTASTAFPIAQAATQNIAYYNSEIKIQNKTTYSDWSATFRLNLAGEGVAKGNFVDMSKLQALIQQQTSFWNKLPGITDWNISTPTAALLQGNNFLKGEKTISTFRYFYEWMMIAYNSSSRVSDLPRYYKKEISLILLNELGEEQKDVSFTLEGAFPVRISGGNLDYANDSILTYNVDFAFDRFYVGLTAPIEI
ncbi:MAG: hypothetical protein WC495_06565 [Patescibacteria group bacterium]|jgi:hypothetical protein